MLLRLESRTSTFVLAILSLWIAPIAPADELTLDGQLVQVNVTGAQAFVSPSLLGAALKRSRGPAAGCDRFDEEMKLVSRRLAQCLPGGGLDAAGSSCKVLKSLIDDSRYGYQDESATPAGVDQSFELGEILTPDPSGAERLQQAFVRSTRPSVLNEVVTDASAELVETGGPSPSIVYGPEAWTPKIMQLLELRESQVNGKSIRTHGREIACDLIQGRASIEWKGTVTLKSRRAAEDKPAARHLWAIRQLHPVSVGTTELERLRYASLSGLRSALYLRDHFVDEDSAGIERAGMHAFDLLTIPALSATRDFGTQATLRAELFPEWVLAHATVRAGVVQP